jgi:pimeloyl-ACP methyl ester carboxylesterase
MAGRRIRPDEYVNLLVENVAREHIPHFTGRFSLHGHSAGAQFAGRYLVTHPGRLDEVVLSAPSTYPMPDPAVPWPNGMAMASGCEFSDAAGARWLAAASEVAVTVLVGSRDTERRPVAPGQQGSTRIERAAAWVESMRRFAEASQRAATIRLVLAEGFDHDEAAMAVPAQQTLARRWRPAAIGG